MQMKAYFASSVPAAVEVARKELGENALLVSSKPAPAEMRQYGRLEVTFAWDPADAPTGRMDEIREPWSELPMVRDGLTSGAQFGMETSDMAERLARVGFSREMAEDIAAGAARRSCKPDIAIVEELTSRIPIAPFVELKPGEARTLAFIGPPGRGKTISLVKIAVNKGLARRVPVRIYCAGAHAVGAQEQGARFAAILGTPFQVFECLASLNLALKGEGWKGLTLIDTPGISPADRNELRELKDFFAARPELEKHLVLRADASSANMLHMLSHFSDLAPSRLLFTGMDEAVRVVSAIETLIRGGVPATFAGTGQQIPEDLEEANAERLARAVWVDAGVTKEELAATAAA